MRIPFFRNAMDKGNAKFSLRKIWRSNLDFHFGGWHQEGHAKMPVSILTPTVVWHGFLALVPRSIALGCIGLLLVGLLSQAQAATSVRLAWNPGTSSGIAGYRVHYGTSSGSYPQILNVGSTTTVTVSGLI